MKGISFNISVKQLMGLYELNNISREDLGNKLKEFEKEDLISYLLEAEYTDVGRVEEEDEPEEYLG